MITIAPSQLPKTKHLKSLLRENLSDDLFSHCVRVGQTAKNYAKVLGLDPKAAKKAGFLHDCAKELSESTLLRIAKENKVPVTPIDRTHVVDFLHATAGRVIAQKKLEIDNADILDAIECHTFGKPEMSALAMLILVADDIEPERKKEYADPVRRILNKENPTIEDLEHAVLKAINIKLERTIRKDELIHPKTIDTRNYFICRLSTENIDKVTISEREQDVTIPMHKRLELLNKKITRAIQEDQMIDQLLIEARNHLICEIDKI